MKAIKYLYICVVAMIATACVGDDTSLGGKPISEIEIGAIAEVYNMEKGDVLTITPSVSQSMTGKELSYTWEIEQVEYSTAQTLTFECDELGSFNARLIVTNEDGSEFFPFVINVNSPYEEGILIVSHDAEGKSMISFMRKNPDTGELAAFLEEDCFALNNPDEHFSSFVSDVTQSNGAVIFTCKGDGSAANPSMIYYINDKTFEIENMVNTSEFPDFAPMKMHVCSKGIGGAAYPILTENGEVYEFASTEGTIIKSVSKLPYTYHRSTAFYDSGSGYQYNILFWDKEIDVPLQIMTGYGPYYCIPEYSDAKDRTKVTSATNMFAGHDLVQMFLPKFTKQQLLTSTPDLYLITKNRTSGMLYRTIIPLGFWSTDMSNYTVSFIAVEKLKMVGFGATSLLAEDSPMVVSGVFKSAYIGVGNKLYQWHYSANLPVASTKEFAVVGTETSVITAVELSADQKQIYVAACDEAQSGKNGSFYILDTETGALVQEYSNVAYRPVKIIYKN